MTTLTETRPDLSTADIARRLQACNIILRACGWALYEVAVNEVTGFVRIIAEARDHVTGDGRRLVISRTHHGGEFMEHRDLIERHDGFYERWWGIVDGGVLGRRSFKTFGAALHGLADYIAENNATGPRELSDAGMRLALVQALELSQAPADDESADELGVVTVDDWRREAFAFFVDAIHGDVAGFTGHEIEARKDERVVEARRKKVGEAHRAWLAATTNADRKRAEMDWAVAVFRLLDWARGMWKCDVLDRAPESVRTKALAISKPRRSRPSRPAE